MRSEIGDGARDAAVESERLKFGSVRVLDSATSDGAGKALLALDLDALPLRDRRLSLRPIASQTDWEEYTEHRRAVEAVYGISGERVCAMIDELRLDEDRLGLRVFLAWEGQESIGGIGFFPVPGTPVARLQEVDIFPPWRGAGRGDALLEAVAAALRADGFSTAVIGADEDDWPLDWYRRRGFRDAARVARPSF